MKKFGVKRLEARELAIDVLCDLAGARLFDLGIYNFAANAEFAPVGVSGLAIIINYLFKAPMGITSILLNIPILLISYKLLGRRFMIKSIKSMLIFSLMLDLVVPFFPVYQGEPLIAAICTGVLSGAGLSIVYLRGGSTGGTDFLVMALRKLFPQFSIGQFTLVVDGCVILLGGVVFRNLDAVILGLIATAATTMIIDKIMYNIGSGKLVFIVTDHPAAMAEGIVNTTGRGTTFLNAQGSYSMDEKKVVMCACNNSQAVQVRRVVKELDPDAFVIVTESNEVFGEGFKSLHEV